MTYIIPYRAFDVVKMRINEACRLQNKSFYAGGSYGLTGFIFNDLINHEYLGP